MGWVRGIPPGAAPRGRAGAARGVPAGRRRHLRESGMRYAVGVPNVGDYGDPRLLVELARDAEAAGWDAVLLWDHVAYRRRGWPVADPIVTLTPAQLGEIGRYTTAHRPAGLGPLEVVVEGHTGGRDRAADHDRVAALQAAGLTSWVEKLGWFHGPIAEARERVAAGPPHS